MNSGKFFVSEVRDTFNALTSSQHILRRQSWYVLAARPAPLPEPERPATPPPPACESYESAMEFERLVLATLPKNANGDEHPASSFHHDGPQDRPDWTVARVEATLRELSMRPAGYAPVKRCLDPACGWYTVLPALPLEPVDPPAQQFPGAMLQVQLLDLAQKGRESLALSEAACGVLEAACSTIALLSNVEVRLKEVTRPAAKPLSSKEMDAWAGANPVSGTDEWYLVNATSEALCREVVWRLATGRLPDACVGALAEVSYWAAQQGKKGD